jgi:DNA-binding response OmpR family regulator
MRTARDDVKERAATLDACAHDDLTKPFSIEELLARHGAASLIRRVALLASAEGGITLSRRTLRNLQTRQRLFLSCRAQPARQPGRRGR